MLDGTLSITSRSTAVDLRRRKSEVAVPDEPPSRVPRFSRNSWKGKPGAGAGGRDSRETRSRGFPQSHVTSNLDLGIQTADYGQGGGGACRNLEPGSNSFVLKILTSKPLGLKILQTNFANPAPVKIFKGGGGGGYPRKPALFPKRTRRKALIRTRSAKLFSAGFVT